MRTGVPAVQPPPALSVVPITRSLYVRGAQDGKIGHLFRLPYRERGFKQPLAGRPNASQGRIPDDLGTRAPQDGQRTLCLRARARHGGDAWPVSPARRDGASSQWRQGRQPSREPGAMDTSTAGRHPCQRRCGVGTRDHRQVRRESTKRRRQPKGRLRKALWVIERQPKLSFYNPHRGDAGYRTRVLRDLSKSSPSAACFAFLSPGDHAGKTPTGSVTVWFPSLPRDRAG